MNYRDTILAKSPWAYYRLSEASGTSVVDASGHSRNATFPGSGVSYQQSSLIIDSINKAVAFDGTNGKFTTPVVGLTTATVEMWIKPTSVSNDRRIMVIDPSGSAGSSANGSLTFDQTNANHGAIYVVVAGAWTKLTNDGSVAVNAVTHLVVVYSGTTVAAYINGVLKNTIAGTFDAATSVIGFGDQYTGFGNRFIGEWDEAAIYTTALTAAQVLENYTAGVTALHLVATMTLPAGGTLSLPAYNAASIGDTVISLSLSGGTPGETVSGTPNGLDENISAPVTVTLDSSGAATMAFTKGVDEEGPVVVGTYSVTLTADGGDVMPADLPLVVTAATGGGNNNLVATGII